LVIPNKILRFVGLLTNAQTYTCKGAPAPITSVVAASGYKFAPIIGNLTTPRGIAVDSKGSVLVVQSGLGLSGHAVDANGCVTSSKIIISDTSLTHGIDVYNKKLYARYNSVSIRIISLLIRNGSSADIAWVWDYDPDTMTVTNKRALVTGLVDPICRNKNLIWHFFEGC